MSLQQLKSQHPYELFQVTETTSATDLKRTFYKLLRQYPNETHPEEFIYLQETYDALLKELESGGFPSREPTPSYETYEYEEIEEQETKARTRTRTRMPTPIEWSKEIDILMKNGLHEEALREARQMHHMYPTDVFAFHYYFNQLIEVGPLNPTYTKDMDELFQSILYQPRQLSSDYLMALLMYIELSPTLPSGEDGRLVALNHIKFMSVTEDEANDVYDHLMTVLRQYEVPAEVRFAFRRVAEMFEPFDARFGPLGQTFYPDTEDVYEERERPVERVDDDGVGEEQKQVAEEDPYSFIGMVVFAFILSAMFTPVVGIIAGIYIHIKRIPIWMYIFGIAIWGVIGIVTLMVLGVIIGFIFG